MNTKTLLIGAAVVAVVAAGGYMVNSQAYNNNPNRQGDYDERGWLGVRKDPEERRGFFPNLIGIPQDVGSGVVGTVTGGRSRDNRRARNEQEYRLRMEQEQRQGRPMMEPRQARVPQQ